MTTRVKLLYDYQTPIGGKIDPCDKYSEKSASLFASNALYIEASKSSLQSQEAILMQDILYILGGHEGQLIRFANSYDPKSLDCRLQGPDYQIARFIDPSFKDLTRSIICCGQWYIGIKAYVDSQSYFENGRVMQAFIEAIDEYILASYTEQVTQIEAKLLYGRDYTLHSLRTDLNYIARQLSCVFNLCQSIILENKKRASSSVEGPNSSHGIKGGDLIRFLCEEARLSLGDPQVYQLSQKLISCASRPYLEMLYTWIHRGVIDDPFNEFLVREVDVPLHFNTTNDEIAYLEKKRYELRENECPPQLSECAVRIRSAGLYLKAYLHFRDPLDEGASEMSQNAQENPTELKGIDDPELVSIIHQSYAYANTKLLSLLHRRDLLGLLSSLRHYFLFDRADFLFGFMDIADTELRKHPSEISVVRLQYLLDMSLRQPGTASFDDDYKDYVEVALSNKSITDYLITVTSRKKGQLESVVTQRDQIIGFESFMLDFKVPFPLSLVVQRGAITRYQFLFRRLLELKSLERDLAEVWRLQSKAIDSNGSNLPVNHTDVLIRTRMMNFVYHVMYHCTVEVLEPRFQQLVSEQIPMCTTVDKVAAMHSAFIDKCMRECMLTEDGLLSRQGQVHNVIRTYTDLYLRPDQRKDREAFSLEEILDGFNRSLSFFLDEINVCADASLLALSAKLHLI